MIYPNTICLTVDVEWAQPAILADLVKCFDERGLKATFFVTHADVNVGSHEYAIHPNFRPLGGTMRRLRQEHGTDWLHWQEQDIYQYVLKFTLEYAPQARGTRSHGLFYDTNMFRVYGGLGLEYDSNQFLPLVPHLQPFWKEYGILELPIYYMDHFDICHGLSDYKVSSLKLEQPGLKVFDFHPNIVLMNSPTEAHYETCKPDHYHDYTWLVENRYQGHGSRSLFLDLLDEIATRNLPTLTLGEINRALRG